jgi:DNA-binding transcriptional regulator GbsR (MarR family)
VNKSYIEWLDYYENATKEDVIQDMMLDIHSIKEKNKEIERLNNIIKEVREYIKSKENKTPHYYEFKSDILEILDKGGKQ